MGRSCLVPFCIAIACIAAAVPASAATLITGGDAADGLTLNPAQIVVALDVGHQTAPPPFVSVQGVTFTGSSPQVTGASLGGFANEFTGVFNFATSTTTDDANLAAIMTKLYFSAQGVDFTVTGLTPGATYVVDVLQSVTETFNSREQAILINGNFVENVTLTRTPADVYDTHVSVAADADGKILIGARPSAGYGGTGPNDGCLINAIVVSTTITQAEVRGTVTDSISGNPVAGATVTLGTRATVTNNAGNYSLFNTSGATLPLTVTSTYAESPYSTTVTLPASGFVTRDVTIAIRPHLTLDTASGFAWKVIGNTGSAPDYSAVAADETAFVPITVPGNWDPIVGPEDDIYGWYRVHVNVPAGFTAAFPGRAIRFHVFGIDDIDATYVNATLVGTTGRFATVPLPVQPAGHTNPPAAGAPLAFYPGEVISWADERSYYFPASLLVPGDNVIAIKVFDLNNAGGIGGIPTLEVVPATGKVTGTFKSGGVGVAGVRVSGMDAVGTSSDWTFTDASGAYTLTHVLPGATVVGAAKPGLDPKAVQVTVPAGGSVTVNFTSTAVIDGGPATLYDDFTDGPDGWKSKWNNIALEPNLPENAPTITEPGFDIATTATIPGTITIQSGIGHRGGLLSKTRTSRYASVNSAKLVSALTANPEPTGGDPNVTFRLIGDAQDDPTLLGAASRYYELDVEGYGTLDDGAGATAQRLGFNLYSQGGGRTAVGLVPLPIVRLGDVSPASPIVFTIVRTGSVYDTYVSGNADGVTGSVLLHTDNIPDAGMLDHKIFPYSFHLDGANTWDWVRTAGAAASVPPVSLATRALRISGGLDVAPTPATGADFVALNAVTSGSSAGKIDVLDAIALAKQGL